MDVASIPLLITLAAAGVACAACSAAETALLSLSASDRLRLRKSHPMAAEAVLRLLSRPRRLLVGLLFANTLAAVTYTVVSTFLAEKFTNEAADLGFRAASLLALILFGETLPKSIASVHAVKFAVVLAAPIQACLRVAWPVITLLDAGLVAPLSRLMRPAGAGEVEPLTPEELAALLRTGARGAGIDEDEQRVLSQVLELGELRVRDAMAPRVDIRWLPEQATREDVIRLSRETGHTKFPLCRGSIDSQVIGLLHAKSYLRDCGLAEQRGASPPPPAQCLRPVLFVPDRLRLDRLLELFRAKAEHVALAVDEFGQITGLVEIEDVVRRLIATESDATDSLADSVNQIDEQTWLVPGRLNIRSWRGLFGDVELGNVEGRISTLAGLIFSKLGRLPRQGDAVRLGNLELTVEAMDGRTVGTVRVTLHAAGGAL